MGKILGLDYGRKRVGVATGDLSMKMSFARTVIENKGVTALLGEVGNLVDELGVSLVVVGLPLQVEHEGRENIIMDDVRYFVKELRNKLPEVEVEFFDERYSSFEADELMNDIEHKGGEKLGRDAYAAQVILQRFFDKMEG